MNISNFSDYSGFSCVDVDYILSNKCNAFAVYSLKNKISYVCNIMQGGVVNDKNEEMELPNLKICRVSNATVSGKGAVSFNESIFSESLQNWINIDNANENKQFIKNKYQFEFVSRNEWILNVTESKTLSDERPMVLLSSPSDNEFFHFMFETLSKLHIFNMERLNDYNWMINDNASYQMDILLRLGINKNNIYVKQFNESVTISDLIFLQPPANHHRWITPEALMFLRQVFLCEKYNSLENEYEKIVFISKKDEANGKVFVSNLDVVKYYINSIGGHCVEINEVSYLQRLNAINNAHILIGEYRTGLLMMFLSSDDSTIVCFQSPGYFRRFPHFIANLIGCRCISIMGNNYKTKELNGNDFYTIKPADIMSLIVNL